jgi:hypothetical protein
MSNYTPGQTVGINPSLYVSEEKQFDNQGEFAALVQVKSSRYVPLEYPAELGYDKKIGVKWEMLSTRGKIFDRTFSTGLKWDDLAQPSPDGKRLIAKSEGFRGLGPKSDALYLLRKAIAAGFPSELITDDISVFEGACFFIATDVNPAWKGSGKKPYPKLYHPEGWEKALAAQQAKQALKAAQQGGSTANATLVNTYTVPQVVVAPDVAAAAGEVLTEILTVSGGKVTRAEIPAKINAIAGGKGWSPKQRQDITLALWDIPQLTSIVGNNPALQIAGEQVSFK